jgi:hypothetical protein
MPDIGIVRVVASLLAKPLVGFVDVMGFYHYWSIVERSAFRTKRTKPLPVQESRFVTLDDNGPVPAIGRNIAGRHIMFYNDPMRPIRVTILYNNFEFVAEYRESEMVTFRGIGKSEALAVQDLLATLASMPPLRVPEIRLRS